MKAIAPLLLVLLTSCTPASDKNSTLQPSSVPQPLVSFRLGEGIPPDLEKKEGLHLFFSNDYHEKYAWNHAGIDYELLKFPGVETVNGIVCRDPRFATPEGVGVGQSLTEVNHLTESKYKTMSGFGYWIPLPSGWSAVFFQGASATDGPLNLDAQVALIARSTHIYSTNQ